MQSMKNKLAVCYRIYPKVSKVPPIYSDDKFKLSELCLKSFADSMQYVEAKIWVLLDNCPDEYNSLFDKYLKGFDYELINLPPSGNSVTFGKQMEILSEQNFSDLIYFAEDDYFYLKSAFKEMTDIIMDGEADFCTPYDHTDSYTRRLHNYKNRIITHKQRHWRTVATTTMTFMTTKENLKAKWSNFHSYTKKNYDGSLWLTITKHNLHNPVKMIYDSSINSEDLRIYAKAFIYLPFEAIFGKKMSLLSPLPSLATHMDNKHLAPYIDWYNEFDKVKNGL